MMVLCSNDCGHGFKELHAEFPNKVGWLISPGSWKNPWFGLRYALDNGAYSAWVHKESWDRDAWLQLLDKATKATRQPLWALVPDSVSERVKTIDRWFQYVHEVTDRGFSPAFAVQDGMTFNDVPLDANGVIFVGGTTKWKWSTLPIWADTFQRVHVGRVRQDKLLTCDKLLVESCDGTGWFREGETGKPRRYLEAWLRGQIYPHPEFVLK